MFASYLVRLRIDPSRADPRFVAAWLQTPSWGGYVAAERGGSAQPQFNASQMKAFRLLCPPLASQRRIGDVIGAFDARVEYSRRVALAAEEVAAAIFRSWFVDFDPVRAKAAGREPVGVPEDAADLFPDRLVESELGPIPEGWEILSLTDLAEYVNGGAYGKRATGSGRMIIRIAELNRGPGSSTLYGDLDVPEKHVAQAGDVLFSWSGTLGVYRWHRPEAIVNQHIFRCVPRGRTPLWLVEYGTRRFLERFRGIAADKATTMGHIKREHLKEARLALPRADEIARLGAVFQPMHDLVLSSRRESLTLEELRDTLLPRLVSGQLCVSTDDNGDHGGA